MSIESSRGQSRGNQDGKNRKKKKKKKKKSKRSRRKKKTMQINKVVEE